MPDCLFCQIVAGKIPAKIVHQDEDTVAFTDINPQAPFHLLVVPREHIPSLNDLTPKHDQVMGKLYRIAASLAKERGVAVSGWRAVVNTGPQGGQLVLHVHLHAMGGRQMEWPPG
jgi:histidine triad (HIT) family protein